MSDRPYTTTIDLLVVGTRCRLARHIVTGFSLVAPDLAGLWGQVDDALSDIPILTAEIGRLSDRLTACRIDRANLAAAGRVTIAAYYNGESDPLAWLRDELRAQGFGTDRGDA